MRTQLIIKQAERELSIDGHVILEWSRRGTFDFNETLNNHGFKPGTVYQTVKFISHFPLKMHI